MEAQVLLFSWHLFQLSWLGFPLVKPLPGSFDTWNEGWLLVYLLHHLKWLPNAAWMWGPFPKSHYHRLGWQLPCMPTGMLTIGRGRGRKGVGASRCTFGKPWIWKIKHICNLFSSYYPHFQKGDVRYIIKMIQSFKLVWTWYWGAPCEAWRSFPTWEQDAPLALCRMISCSVITRYGAKTSPDSPLPTRLNVQGSRTKTW